MKPVILFIISFILMGFVSTKESREINGTTQDFEFLIGKWNVEVFALDSSGEVRAKRVAMCNYTMEKSYIQCIRENKNGPYMMSFHNFNNVYGFHESLYLSTWPIKPLGKSILKNEGETIFWTNTFEFPIEEGETEFVRAEMKYEKGVIETFEYIMRTKEGVSGDWKLEYRERLTRLEG